MLDGASVALYAFTLMGTNVLYVFARYGTIAGTAKAVESAGTVVLVSGAGASLATASALAVTTSTPFVVRAVRWPMSLVRRRFKNKVYS